MLKNNELVSAFMDNELEEHEARQIIQLMKQEETLQKRWQHYHLIGDTLRNHLSASFSNKFSQRLTAALDHEPHYFAPRRHKASLHNDTAGFALAASISAVAIVGLLQFGQPTIMTAASHVYETDMQSQHSVQSSAMLRTALVDHSVPADIYTGAVDSSVYATIDDVVASSAIGSVAAIESASYESNVYDYLVNFSQFAVSTPFDMSTNLATLSF